MNDVDDPMGALLVVRATRATFQDLGRPGGEQLGLSTNGAADQFSARAANLLVANAPDAVLCELVVFDLELVARTSALLAVTGLDCSLRVDGQTRACWEPQVVSPGQRVRITLGPQGARAYLAVHGGLLAPALLGSSAPDPVVGFGQSIEAGTDLRFPAPFSGFPFRSLPVFRLAAAPPRLDEVWSVDLVPVRGDGGLPRLRQQLDAEFTVSTESNQIGLRLSGARLIDVPTDHLVSRGVPVGGIEVPPSGEVIVLLAGRFVTAGYPIVAVATRSALDLLGQARPGRRLRFAWQSRTSSVLEHRRRLSTLRRLEERTRSAFTACGYLSDSPRIVKPG